MIEEWKEIEGFSEYLISSFGNIKRKDGRTQRVTISKRNGSSSVCLKRDCDKKAITFQISKLVAIAFVQNPNNYHLVFHIDKNVSNDYYRNLIWKTNKNRYLKMDNYYVGYDINEKEFYFDLCDYEIVKQYQWYIKSDGYVFCSKTKTHKAIYLHQLIMNNIKIIDHINRKRNDNRRENLRETTIQQNNYNQSIGKGNTSGFLGVTKETRNTKKSGTVERWRTQIRHKGKHISKTFRNKEDAIKYRLELELKYYGKEYSPNRNLFEKYGIK